MYDELVKRLRNRRICIQQLGTLNDYPLLGEAADAIEELSRQLAEYHSYDGFLMAHGCFVELPKPPKEE